MRTTLLTAIFVALLFSNCLAQVPSDRRITMSNYGADSLHIPLNDEYAIIEDSCARIVRHVRFNREKAVFYGNFADHSKSDPALILSQGSYTKDGLKTGLFTIYYTNGKLRAQGNYTENEFDGTWNLYYETGAPKLTFKAVDGEISIINAWDADGTQTVKEGIGKYTNKGAFITWSGQILNGKPEGTWTAVNTTDRSKKAINIERFKDGEFKRGTSPIGPYTNAPRVSLLNSNDFPYINAERMVISSYKCEAKPKGVKVVGAQFRNGIPAYSEEIKLKLSGYLSTIDLKSYENELTINAEVAEDGRLINFTYSNAFNERIASGIVRSLRSLPALEPALVNGEPVRQKFEIKFKFHAGIYQFNYRFLPIPLKNI
ncbi:toxin-antitoxin system YwqK family antitoxin [Pontibacter cellulosilyticus]|uniref:MORN repeat variant n=1 Tax=Pontibacter cellulosilyticus TaxID=1720253 RepID=A0A923N771_9BACT|nr:hypothetical protein [Pontibacter cellulosilyticus]MBC5993044.1 hypothetical protein [Pontibacter cellulosilyticus]